MQISYRPVPMLTVLAALACSSDPTPPPETPASVAAPTETAPTPDTKTDDDPTRSKINIDESIKQACGLTDIEAHFSYNSAKVRSSDRTILKKLADCFSTGALQGRSMNLVGHADPRGEPEYNMVLGGRRADNVATGISSAGLSKSQINTTSRGELDARGTDESSWAEDRRVDIYLAEEE